MRSGVLRWFGVGVLGLAGVWAAAQGGAPVSIKDAPKVTVVEPPAPLLPSDAELVAGSPVPGDSGEAQAIFKEDGLVRTETRGIASAAGAGTAPAGWVKAYQFGDATGAYAAYTWLRNGGRARTPGSRLNDTEAVTASGQTVLLSGVTVVLLDSKLNPGAAEGLLKHVVTGLPKVGGRAALAPLLPTMLPAEGLDRASVRYALGPVGYQSEGGVLPAGILSWDKDAEAITANYTGARGSHGTLTVLMYPTPQIAGDRGRAIEKALNDAGGTARFGTVKLRRVGPLLGLTTGPFSPEQAASLVGALHLTQVLSYDKPMPLEFHAEVQKTASLLENIAVLCGVLILAAILLGLFLGGARAGWRVMRGKPAASEPEFLTISLRDSSPAALKIHATDVDAP